MSELFYHDKPCVYTMPPHVSFLDELAAGLRTSLGEQLSEALILLPTRRAIRALGDAFVRTGEERATLLPLMRTLADLDENEPPFAPGDLDLQIPETMDAARCQFELAKLSVQKIRALKQGSADAASVLAMSAPLSSLLSDLALEEIDASAFENLNEGFEKLPLHFQDAGVFAEIAAKFWPQFLEERGTIDPVRRRVALLDAACKIWQDTPPNHPVIVAGSTGSMAATARLIACVANLPKGLVVLPGLDVHMDEQAWDDIDDQHPQAGLKALLGTMSVERQHVSNWPGVSVPHKAQMRRQILSQSLIPANATSDWPARIALLRASVSKGNPLQEGLSGLSLIEAKTEEEEAGVIALILRGVLEDADKTGILVTPDPALARRVQAKLSRWDVAIDSSAGEPLEETQRGSFLSLSLQAAIDPFDPVAICGLVGHALFAGRTAAWDGFEKAALRGIRPVSLAAIEKKLKGRHGDGFEIYKTVHAALRPLSEKIQTPDGADKFANIHADLAQTLSGDAHIVWRGPAGEEASGVIKELLDYGHLLPPVDGHGYQRLLSQMMRGRVVRPRTGMSERLQILGPLEARMAHADVFVLGGLNEGVWPASLTPHPMLSAKMRRDIGLSARERRTGLAAHDFAQLAAKDTVILTRSARTADGPSVQSRWLWRLTTLVRGALLGEASDVLSGETPWLEWARALDVAPTKPTPATRPAPRPPLDKRWPEQSGGRRLSVTQIQTWIRDPYAVYAKKILRLAPLDALDQKPGGREYGSAVHRAAEALDGLDAQAFTALLKGELAKEGFATHSFARHNIRLGAMAAWLVDWTAVRQAAGWQLWVKEEKGEIKLATDGLPFVLSGTPDRIEQRGDEFAVSDYKTGTAPTDKVVQAGFDPQMPLLGLMLSFGAFGDKADAADFLYVNPRAQFEKSLVFDAKGKIKKEADEFSGDAYAALQNLIAHFDDPKSAYYSQPRAQFVNPYGDYDHLARRAEWAAMGEEEGET